MSYTEATLQLLSPDGSLVESDAAAEYLPYIEKLSDAQLREFHRVMVMTRALDLEGTNLQRQGQMALWVPSLGQEAAQVGSGFAMRPQDHIFPSYREHAVGIIRGIDPLDIIRLLRGVTHGGWNADERGNFHIYTLVLGSQTLHATGFAMGITLDGLAGTGDPEFDQAVITYFGDGSTSQGDVNEALVFAASYQTPELFFLQNNQWAISVPVSRQSRTPLYLRAGGFGIPGIQIDGNDVLISYAAVAQVPRGDPGWRRPALHRGGDLPDGRAHLERRPDEVPGGCRDRDLGGAGSDRAVRDLSPRSRRGRRVLRRPRRRSR